MNAAHKEVTEVLINRTGDSVLFDNGWPACRRGEEVSLVMISSGTCRVTTSIRGLVWNDEGQAMSLHLLAGDRELFRWSTRDTYLGPGRSYLLHILGLGHSDEQCDPDHHGGGRAWGCVLLEVAIEGEGR